jgi:hypothetical protein
MPDRRSTSTSTSLFTDPREAFGWLVTQWAGFLVASLVMAWLLQGRLLDLDTSSWGQLGLGMVVLALGGLNVWGHVVSSSARPRLREAIRQRQLPWWGRDGFVSEHAAARLGWSPTAVVWTGRLLLLVTAVVTTSAMVAFILT